MKDNTGCDSKRWHIVISKFTDFIISVSYILYKHSPPVIKIMYTTEVTTFKWSFPKATSRSRKN